MLLADVVDGVRQLMHLYVISHTDGRRPAPPRPVPRPGVAVGRADEAARQAVIGKLERIRAAHGGPITD